MERAGIVALSGYPAGGRAFQGLLPKRLAGGRTRAGEAHRLRCDRQPGATDTAAVARGADAVLVHHGYFWRGEDGRVTGMRRKRLATLIGHDINLIAHHLPLMRIPELGQQCAARQVMGWEPDGRFGDQDLGWTGALAHPLRLDVLARERCCPAGGALMLGRGSQEVRRVAWKNRRRARFSSRRRHRRRLFCVW